MDAAPGTPVVGARPDRTSPMPGPDHRPDSRSADPPFAHPTPSTGRMPTPRIPNADHRHREPRDGASPCGRLPIGTTQTWYRLTEDDPDMGHQRRPGPRRTVPGPPTAPWADQSVPAGALTAGPRRHECPVNPLGSETHRPNPPTPTGRRHCVAGTRNAQRLLLRPAEVLGAAGSRCPTSTLKTAKLPRHGSARPRAPARPHDSPTVLPAWGRGAAAPQVHDPPGESTAGRRPSRPVPDRHVPTTPARVQN